MKTFIWGFVIALFLVGVLGNKNNETEEEYVDETPVCFFENDYGRYEYDSGGFGCIDLWSEYHFDELDVEITNDVKYYSIFTEYDYDLDAGYIQLYYFYYNTTNGYKCLKYYVYDNPIYKEEKEYVCSYLNGEYTGNCAAMVRNIMDEYAHNVLLFENRAEFPNDE